MFNSIRWRLLAWQLAILLAVIIGFASALFWQLRRATYDEADADLFGAAQIILAQFEQADGSPELAIPTIYRHRAGPNERDSPYFAIWDKRGKLLASSRNADEDLRPEPRLPPIEGPRPYVAREHGPNREVIIRGRGNIQVLVGRPLHREGNYLRSLAGGIVLAGLGALGLGLLGAWLLARAIVRPLEHITQTAERISATNLADRVPTSKRRDELGRLATVLNQMFDRLQQSFERQTRFTSDASHELRTPVAVVLSQAELALAKERSPEEYRGALEACLRASRRMKLLVEGLLTLARSDAGRLTLEHESVALAEVVESSVQMLKPLADQKQIGLTTELAPVTVTGDAQRLGQVVANLVANAITYNRPQGSIRITLAEQAGQAVLSVADTGIGIDVNDLPKVFDRFFRADPARTGHEAGSGLGLAICREIVRSHGGTIEVASKAGEGTTFTVRLPLASVTPLEAT